MDRNQLKAAFGEILTEVTGETYGELQDEQKLQDDLKLDSLDLVSMAIEFQARMGVVIEPTEVTGIVTVRDLVDLVAKKLTAGPTSRAA